MTTPPATIDEVTPAWVAEATGLDVTDIEVEYIGVGVAIASAVYRLSLTGTDVPDTLILKLPASTKHRCSLRRYCACTPERPSSSANSPTHHPSVYHVGTAGAANDDGTGYYLFMEDMGGHRPVDQIAGMIISDAEQAVDEMAKWHATFWGKADRHLETGAAVCFADDLYRAVLPLVFDEGWERIQANMGVHPTIAEVAPQWTGLFDEMHDALSVAPTTLVHGDYRADNLFFADDGNYCAPRLPAHRRRHRRIRSRLFHHPEAAP